MVYMGQLRISIGNTDVAVVRDVDSGLNAAGSVPDKSANSPVDAIRSFSVTATCGLVVLERSWASCAG